MSWRELITGIYATRPQQPGIAGKPKFYPAASGANIADAQAGLNAALPASIRSLLLETNGVMHMMAIDAGEWFESMWLLWTTEEVIEQNRFYRAATDKGTYDRDFRRLVFFAGAASSSRFRWKMAFVPHWLWFGIRLWMSWMNSRLLWKIFFEDG